MAKARIVTMQQVADDVGLTRAAVSLALRGHTSIPEKTQARVREAARRLGYRTNPLVSALMSYHLQLKPGRSGLTLAFVTSHPPDDPWTRYPAYVQMFNGAKQRANELGCRLEEFALSQLTPTRVQGILRARGIRGVLVAPLHGNHTVFPVDISEFSAVGLGTSVVTPSIMRVASDHYQLARLAVAQCVELGYRRPGFAVSAEMSERLEHRLLAGFRQGVAEAGLTEVVPPLMSTRMVGISEFVPRWCERQKPDVVVFGTFDRDCLLKTPPEIGCVDLSVMDRNSQVSGIHQNLGRIGAIAVEQLLAQLHHNATGPIAEPQAHLLHGTWVSGQTAPGPGRRRVQVRGRQKDT